MDNLLNSILHQSFEFYAKSYEIYENGHCIKQATCNTTVIAEYSTLEMNFKLFNNPTYIDNEFTLSISSDDLLNDRVQYGRLRPTDFIAGNPSTPTVCNIFLQNGVLRFATPNTIRLIEFSGIFKINNDNTIVPFVFKSNCHQRYENSQPKMGLQECSRTICVEKNIDGCNGYKIEPGVGYIVKIFNNDMGKPNMSDKPMKVVRKTEKSVELRGFPIEAMTPFGWQEVDYSVYGLIVYYEHNKVSKCLLHMYDRNTFIEYRHVDKTPLVTADTNSTISECEQYAQQAQDAANIGNTSKAHQYGLKVYDSIISKPLQLKKVQDIQSVALALGKLMKGDYFSDNDSIKKAVGLTYYFLSKAIANGNDNPYLYSYRFSVTWEYNKAFYHFFAQSEGMPLIDNPYNPFGQSMLMAYDHHLQGMQMADMLSEPRIANLDPALGNIFNEIYSRYSSTPSEQIIKLGTEYHAQIFKYLDKKIAALDFDF